jgi:RNA polymerase sigma factor (TIGR02999 family)
MSEVSRILEAVARGEKQAAVQLLPLVYQELRQLAARQLAGEKPGQTLQPTALVHEAYLRLVGPGNADGFSNRRHFFGAAAEAMRRVLVENARGKQSQKRGGGWKRVDLDQVPAADSERNEEVLDVDAALSGLALADAQAAELVKLRYFAGLSIAQAAEVLDISPRSADFVWAYARAWLLRFLHNGEGDAS